MEPFPFLSLPRELREQIYSIILNEPVEPLVETRYHDAGDRTYIFGDVNIPDRAQTPGYHRAIIHCRTFHSNGYAAYVPNSSRYTGTPNLSSAFEHNMRDFRALLLVCRQIRLEALEVFRRLDIALEYESEHARHEIVRLWHGELPGNSEGLHIPASIQRLHLFLYLKPTKRDVDTRVRPIIRIELIEEGRYLTVSSDAPFKAEHAMLMRSHIRAALLHRIRWSMYFRFGARDLMRAVMGISAVEEHLYKDSHPSRRWGVRSHPNLEIEPGEADVVPVVRSKISVMHDGSDAEYMLTGKFEHVILDVRAFDCFV
jgi:hypothetical protein